MKKIKSLVMEARKDAFETIHRTPLDSEKKRILKEVAKTVRALSMEAVEKANSGHPGLPMGCAELGAYLWGEFMHYNPKDENEFNSDRFVLSAGHGSMFLYSMLHLSGYDLSMDEIKRFRQIDSRTPGHPESHETAGVLLTTGPLGQGVGNAVGIALAYKIFEDRFNREGFSIVDNKVICLAGDGCLMEGVSTEASSLAGHLCLNNLILVYDMNYVTLDGYWKESCSDNQVLRYKSMGWDVIEIADGNDLDQIHSAFQNLRGPLEKPTIVIIHTVIGKGAPTKQGTPEAHGSPLGAVEMEKTKKNLGIPEENFIVPPTVREYFAEVQKKGKKKLEKWGELFTKWKGAHPDLYKEFKAMKEQYIPQEAIDEILALQFEPKIAGRKVSNGILQVLGKHLPQLIGGSADLSGSDGTTMKAFAHIDTHNFKGKNIKYGTREFGMSTMMNGMATTFIRPFGGTFFCFSDYARNAVRLAALSHYPSIFIYTHDSICIGEDGPTHQPIEHLASFRAMPGMHLWRTADANEAKAAWIWTIKHHKGPVILVFTRQNLPSIPMTPQKDFENNLFKGGYILIEEDKQRPIDLTLISTGSELHLAVEVADRLKKAQFGNKNVRVVSLPCWHLFEEQDQHYRESILGGNLGLRVSIEAASTFGWERYIGQNGLAIGVDNFGLSAPLADILPRFGFTADQIIERIMTKVRSYTNPNE